MSSLNRRCRCEHYNSLASGLALSTLEMYSDFEFFEVLVEPDWQGKSNNLGKIKLEKPEVKRCKVYSNPTKGIWIGKITIFSKP